MIIIFTTKINYELTLRYLFFTALLDSYVP